MEEIRYIARAVFTNVRLAQACPDDVYIPTMYVYAIVLLCTGISTFVPPDFYLRRVFTASTTGLMIEHGTLLEGSLEEPFTLVWYGHYNMYLVVSKHVQRRHTCVW